MTVPVTIAHRAGNSYERLERALAAGVDAVEIDVRLDRGRFAGRHDGRLFFLPIYGGRWYLRFSLTRATRLDDVLRRVEGRASLLVDVKNTSRRALELLLDTLRARGAIAGTRMSAGYWDLMGIAQESEPELKVYYSMGKPEELRRFWQLQAKTHEAKGVSIKERLLDKALVDELLAEGIEIAAYDIHDLRRARELVAWGVAIIISGDLSLLRALKVQPQG
jgi:glycerophosphoryl diester phosphodiesterase